MQSEPHKMAEKQLA